MKVLFLTDGPQNPAGRFRCEQFFPLLERAGIECHERYAYGRRYNALLASPFSTAYRTLGRLRRAAWTVASPGYDLLFFQRTALSVTALPELLRSSFSTPTIFDFDDAIYLGPNGTPSAPRMRAFRSAVRRASWLIAGNAHLADTARHPAKTTVIPTVVDTTKLSPGPRTERSTFTIGWMGTSSNFVHLRTVLPELLAFVSKHAQARLRIVSNQPLAELKQHPQTEFVPWSEETEADLLRSFDVGLMPLIDSEVARGKCAFKILQYMAVGIPVVASAVGANINVLSAGDAGHLVPPGGRWTPALLELIHDQEIRVKLGNAGRLHVEQFFSRESVIGTYIELFRRLIEQRPTQSARVEHSL
ncbi:MAG: glycosyltransferase family 4 protein [Myxococcaceae bacterium]|nr:glycosyltransferase family 4 protein [Myxococcaceae bacterium]